MHRVVARASGVVFGGVALAMFGAAALGFLFEHASRPDRAVDDGATRAMLASSALVALVAGGLVSWGRRAADATFTRREATVAVSAIWFGTAVLGGVPYVIDAGLSVPDAIFESASGFTTTGATVVTDIEGSLSHTLLLWRSLTHWLGGMGIVVLFVAVFPSLGVSAKHMYRSEVPGHASEGLQPRIAETSLVLWRYYLAFSAVLVGLLWFAGMDLFDAVNHAWATMATGGFSTRNASIGAFDSPAIEWIVTVFMLLAGANYALYFAIAVTGRWSAPLRSIELRVYLGLVAVCTLVVAASTLRLHDGSVSRAVRHAAFTVASMITSTGFGVTDYMAWPPLGLFLLVVLMLVGGMSGSTAGGIKVSRLVILVETAWVMLRRSVRPQVVEVVRLDRKVLDDEILLEVGSFFFAYLACLGVGVGLICAVDGVGVPTAFGATLSALSNMGPAPWYDGADHFANYSGPAKLVFSAVMILGRLELLTVLALLLPDLWRR